MKYNVCIPEVHKILVEVELPEGATRDQIVEVAQDKFMDIDLNDVEYSHTLEQDEWTVRTENDDLVP